MAGSIINFIENYLDIDILKASNEEIDMALISKGFDDDFDDHTDFMMLFLDLTNFLGTPYLPERKSGELRALIGKSFSKEQSTVFLC